MTLDEFKVIGNPNGLTPLLQALWYDANQDWQSAHQIAQELHTQNASCFQRCNTLEIFLYNLVQFGL
jgi:hypothetical protein